LLEKTAVGNSVTQGRRSADQWGERLVPTDEGEGRGKKNQTPCSNCKNGFFSKSILKKRERHGKIQSRTMHAP